jgi:hypothetical protein
MIDYLSALLLLSGYIITGTKNRWGWILSALGNIGYIYLMLGTEFKGMLTLSVIMFVVCINNFIKWGKMK